MAAAALLEEQLVQNSLATSEEDADFEEDNELAADLMADNADAFAANIQLQSGIAEALIDQREEEEEAMDEDQDILSDVDAEGEDDDEMVDPKSNSGEIEEEDEEDEEASDDDDDEEGVGAVKIHPSLLEYDEDIASASEEESAASVEDDDESKESTDAEVEEQWQRATEEEEEEEGATNPNRCMYVLYHTSRTVTDPFVQILPAG